MTLTLKFQCAPKFRSEKLKSKLVGMLGNGDSLSSAAGTASWPEDTSDSMKTLELKKEHIEPAIAALCTLMYICVEKGSGPAGLNTLLRAVCATIDNLFLSRIPLLLCYGRPYCRLLRPGAPPELP